ncbi:MAG: alpha/beta hydrolase [Nannocystaceae bacterium]|nr:alpha/beta hydrolase [Nannocystaceae bacterium]
MQTPEETTLKVPGFELAARVWGPLDGRRVLALHGWLDNAATFDGLAPRLPGCRIVALDMPGHGHSTHAAPGAVYPFIDFVAAAHGALDALGWETCTLMGHSLGSSVCAVLAGTTPDRVDALVLLEGVGPLTTSAADAPQRLAGALREQALKRERPMTTYPDVAHVAKALAFSPSKLTPASIQTLLGRGLRHTEGGVQWRSDRRLRYASRVRMTEAQVLAFLDRIRCPTLLLLAEDGLRMPETLMAARLAAIADLESIEVPGHHHVHLDAPQTVAPAVAEFLERGV